MEPTDEAIEESLAVEEELLRISKAAVYGLYMSDTPRPASILALQAQVITWEQVQKRSSEDAQL